MIIPTTMTRWHGIRVARHAQDNREPITGAIGPFLSDIAPMVERAYYLPHWRRGPHIRILVDCPDETFDQDVLPLAERSIGGYLSAHRNRSMADPEALLDQHRRLAEMEGEPGPLTPWYPDNTVAAEDFPSRAAALGSEDAAELLADFYTDATPLALRMTAIDDQAALFASCFDLLVSTAQFGAPAGLSRGFLAFRSHAEAYLTMAPEGPGLRAAWERQYATAAGHLVTRAGHVVADATNPSRATPSTAWATALGGVADRIRELSANGAIRLADTDASGGPLMTVAAASPFHRQLQAQDWWNSGFAGADWFKAYRVMLNFGYLHLTRVGITPVRRFLLCYLASRAAEDLYGLSANELISNRERIVEGA